MLEIIPELEQLNAKSAENATREDETNLQAEISRLTDEVDRHKLEIFKLQAELEEEIGRTQARSKESCKWERKAREYKAEAREREDEAHELRVSNGKLKKIVDGLTEVDGPKPKRHKSSRS